MCPDLSEARNNLATLCRKGRMSDEMKSTRPSLADDLSLDQQHPNIRSDVRSGAR